jgi:hypothetical protein
MVTLDACTSFCTALNTALGPQITEWICIAGVAALAWWRTRKVHVAAQAGIAAATADANDAKLRLARIEGSLRPAAPSSPTPGETYAVIGGKLVSTLSLAPTLPPLAKPPAEGVDPAHELGGNEGITSASGTYQPVKWPPMPEGTPKARPSMVDPNLADPQIPRPSAVPKLDDDKGD